MKLDPDDIEDLRPVIAIAVAETVEKLRADESKVNGRLAYGEAEAAELLGLAKHQLRDMRLRGEIKGRRAGKGVLYSRTELLKFLGTK